MAAKLTKRQNEVLTLIKEKISNSGMPPTRAEIANSMGFSSPNAAEDHLRALARKGVIELKPGTSRGIILLEPLESGLPIVGQVAAGIPILSEENIEGHHSFDRDIFKNSADYLLRVKGDSMIEAGIMDGDLLVVHKTKEVVSGELVVARIDEEVTVKKYYREGDRVTLKPANGNYNPIEVDLSKVNFDIEGRGVGVIRTDA